MCFLCSVKLMKRTLSILSRLRICIAADVGKQEVYGPWFWVMDYSSTKAIALNTSRGGNLIVQDSCTYHDDEMSFIDNFTS